MTNQHDKFPGTITCLISYPTPPKLTLWEWLGVKKRPPVAHQRLYAAVGSTIFISNDEGRFDYSLNTKNEKADI